MNLTHNGLFGNVLRYKFAALKISFFSVANNFLITTNMKKQVFFTIAFCALGMFSAKAQLYVTEKQAFITGVSDNGIAVGTTNQNEPYFLWDPVNNEMKTIGGLSSGNGIGGVGRISADGKIVYGTQLHAKLPMSAAWDKSDYPELRYRITGFVNTGSGSMYAAGVNAEGNSIVLESNGEGNSWKSNVSGVNVFEGSNITSFGYASMYFLFAGCDNGKMFKSKANSTWLEWDVHPKDNTTEVKAYTAVDFTKMAPSDMYCSGGIGYEAVDGSYGVWYTKDANFKYSDFNESKDVMGVPTCIHFVDGKFFMTTRNGYIQKSEDNCESWGSVFYTEGLPLYKICFNDKDNGIAISDQYVYITEDGGWNWTKKSVIAQEINPFANSERIWNDVTYTNDRIILCGENGRIYDSVDRGKTFSEIDMLAEFADASLNAVYYNDKMFIVAAGEGVFLKKRNVEYMEAVSGSRFDVETETWTPLEHLGASTKGEYPIMSSVESISDNGDFAVGSANFLNKETNLTNCVPAIWDNNGNITQLDNMFLDVTDRAVSAKATAVSADGSVVVGWQDRVGPWVASVWRRQEDGSYKQQIMFMNPETKLEDVDLCNFDDIKKHCAGAANAVSPNGKWIGGKGDGGAWLATENAWIWSEETGYVDLGDLGTTMEVSDDGKTAVGYGASGLSAWIWKEGVGMRDLNVVASELNAKFDGFQIVSVYTMSPNGRYLAGWGMKGQSKYAYVLDLEKKGEVANADTEMDEVSVCRNSATGNIEVYLPMEDLANTTITLYNVSGIACCHITDCCNCNTIDANSLTAGVYMVKVNSGNESRIFKVIVE